MLIHLGNLSDNPTASDQVPFKVIATSTSISCHNKNKEKYRKQVFERNKRHLTRELIESLNLIVYAFIENSFSGFYLHNDI